MVYRTLLKITVLCIVLSVSTGCPIKKPDHCGPYTGDGEVGVSWTWTFGQNTTVNDQFVTGIALKNTYSISNIGFYINDQFVSTNSNLSSTYSNQIIDEMTSLGLYDANTENIFLFQTDDIINNSNVTKAEMLISFSGGQLPDEGEALKTGMTTVQDLNNGLADFSTFIDVIGTSVPSLSQWSIILLVFLTLTLSTVLLPKRQQQP